MNVPLGALLSLPPRIDCARKSAIGGGAKGSPCEQAGRDAERNYGLPVGLLGAIGKVESGRWDPALGRVVPSPWAIDAAGQPYLSDNRSSALQMAHALQDGGLRNIDVGCFQINLKSHPAAFTDLEQAFDPAANAQVRGAVSRIAAHAAGELAGCGGGISFRNACAGAAVSAGGLFELDSAGGMAAGDDRCATPGAEGC